MNQELRRARIVDIIMKNSAVKVEELAHELHASLATIRRDLTYLEKQGQILRTFGGAVSVPSSTELSLQKRALTHLEAKNRIAQAALPLLLTSQSVILDAGTTTGCLARLIPNDVSLTVITNGLNILMDLAYQDQIDLIALGGSLRHLNQAFIGDSAIMQLQTYHVDTCFLGAFGLDPGVGLTSPTAPQAYLKRKMAEAANKVYILADSSKFSISFPHVTPLPHGVTVITEKAVDSTTAKKFHDRHWNIVSADEFVDANHEGSA
ncbi:MAG: DeoR/GlpR transcriptional regulator [Sulfobacillus thermosulfidooxidans]|uniref:DeoR/GlpR transcriptional regulator n=1 Tax=Sulfobacillus thermosulfidooxidans TaxID=28034 RepID=A0A2T2WU61_SULTH|nr:MAG: DeoR/GlpR transcriptional regulator [Sulfobacillus thermosulfidooxidans]